jgi:hypothetical protein
VSLTVTDDGGATDTATQDVTVTDGGSNTMHVHDSIAQGTTGNGKNKNGTATVTIYNESESAVANATVTVVFSGSFNETVSGTTDASGVVTVVTLAKAKNPVFSTCVDDVTHASLTYDPFVNEDPNADCNGGGTPPTDVHVEDITTSTQGGGPNKRGRATVAVFDDLGNPAVGYVVAGTFSGSYTETKTGTTGSDGQVTLTTSGRVATPEFEFCVDSVTGALPYNSSANVVTCASYPPPAAAAKGAVAGETPEGYALDQNYPNPFNPATVITYSLAEAGPVTLKVYNVLGQEVATLVDGFEEAGSHRVGFEAAHLSAGVYLYVIEAEGFTDTRRMTLLK